MRSQLALHRLALTFRRGGSLLAEPVDLALKIIDLLLQPGSSGHQVLHRLRAAIVDVRVQLGVSNGCRPLDRDPWP